MIETIDELRDAVSSANPVVVAGYSRESTHKGYLSWILDSRRNKRSAVSLVKKLLKELGCAEIQFNRVEATQEAKISGSRSKVDLMLHRFRDDNYSQAYEPVKLIPIELKVESGPSGDKQIPDLGEQASILILLGSASVRDQWYTMKKDHPNICILRPLDIVRLFRPECSGDSGYLVDWLRSIESELAREIIAQEVLSEAQRIENEPKSPVRQVKIDSMLFFELDYASDKHLWFYVYKKLRNCCPLFSDWLIEDSNFNPLLSEPIGKFKKQERAIEIHNQAGYVYFSFAYGDLRVQVDFEKSRVDSFAPLDVWRQWTTNIQQAFKTECSIQDQDIVTCPAKHGTYPTLMKMTLRPFTDFALLENNAREFISATIRSLKSGRA